MTPGSIVKVALQQNDGRLIFRPALVLFTVPPYDDIVVCGISKSIDLEVNGFDLVIDESHSDFQVSGLKYAGLIRLGFLTTLSLDRIEGRLGYVSADVLSRLQKRLSNHIVKNPS